MKMESFFEELLIKQKATLQESLIAENSGADLWHCTVVDRKGDPLAGGFGDNRQIARKIALAELVERLHVQSCRAGDPKLQKRWGMDLIPTACGFAAGFNLQNTIARSIYEASERWVMSKWIDEHYLMDENDAKLVIPTLDLASLYFMKQFQEVRFFKKQLSVYVGNRVWPVTIGQTIALDGKGIFPGSSAQFKNGNLWQHALLESFRHLLISRNNRGPLDQFPENRIKFFSQEKGIGIASIERARIKEWPIPKVKFHHAESFANGQYFIARTILSGWQSWHEGPVNRFVF